VIPLYGGTTALCTTLSEEQLEKTFFFPAARYDMPPSKAAQAAWDEAKEICLDCPFMQRCALDRKGEEFGVWGGTDQYERYLERRRLSQRRQRSADDVQAAEAARVYAMHAGHRGLPVHEVAFRTGHSVKAVNLMIEAHKAATAAPVEPEAPVQEVRRSAPVWPADWPPSGDTWVWADGAARSGHVVAVTADGAYTRVKFRGARKAHVIRWFPADQVQIRTQTTVPVAEFKGRTDGEVDRGAEAA
jgi:hypothetical protein